MCTKLLGIGQKGEPGDTGGPGPKGESGMNEVICNWICMFACICVITWCMYLKGDPGPKGDPGT